MIYAFEHYELDTRLYELRHAGTPQKLEPQVFDILVYLIRQRDRVVTKQELLEQLWPEQYVSDATLYHRLMTARKALGDSGRAPRLLKTLHGRGYRFSAAVEERDHVIAAAVAPACPTQGESAKRDTATPQADTAPPGPASPTFSRVWREEQRVVTILCGTLANAAAIVKQRGFAVLQKLQQALAALVQDVVQHYGGMLQPAGQDEFIALFGVPVAYEDHARRAVLAALTLHQRLHERHQRPGAPPAAGLAVRLGVHTGMVLVGPDGNESHRPWRVLGDALTLAQQLQRVAPPRALLVSEATWRRLPGDVQGERFGPVQTATHTALVMAYTIRTLGPWRAPFLQREGRTVSRFVGRKRELAMLLAALGHIEPGQGQVMGIMGEPGMGKSRLLYEFSQHLAGKPVTYKAELPCKAHTVEEDDGVF
jgi:DNA-binding winged helix-turn-helix (wHTH) protein